MEVHIPDQTLAARSCDAWKAQPGLGERDREAARDSFEKNSPADHIHPQRSSLTWDTRLVKQTAHLLHLIFHFDEPD
jgi:hypothetical protein